MLSFCVCVCIGGALNREKVNEDQLGFVVLRPGFRAEHILCSLAHTSSVQARTESSTNGFLGFYCQQGHNILLHRWSKPEP